MRRVGGDRLFLAEFRSQLTALLATLFSISGVLRLRIRGSPKDVAKAPADLPFVDGGREVREFRFEFIAKA